MNGAITNLASGCPQTHQAFRDLGADAALRVRAASHWSGVRMNKPITDLAGSSLPTLQAFLDRGGDVALRVRPLRAGVVFP